MKTAPILRNLSRLRSRIRSLLFLHASCMVLLIGGALAVASFLLDWTFHLPLMARTVMLLAAAGILVHYAIRFFSGSLRLALDDDALALLVESRRPEIKEELISAIQFERQLAEAGNTESHELMQASIDAALRRFENETFTGLVDARPLARPAFFSVAALLFLAVWGAIFPEHASLWLDRCLLLRDREWPPRTRLEVTIANLDKFAHRTAEDGAVEIKVPEGSVLRVDVVAKGEVPSSIWIRRFNLPRQSGDAPVTIEMPGRPGSDAFDYRFGRLGADFEFSVEGGDDRDGEPRFRILVRSAPRVDELAIDYDFPDYINSTGQADRKGVREYNVMAPAGTAVTMSFKTSSPLQSFRVTFDDEGKEGVDLVADAQDPTLFRWRFDLDQDRRYSLRLLGENGTPSREVPFFNITAQPDIPPQISILMPESGGIDVTPTATLPIEFQIEDDYEIGAVEFRWDVEREGVYANRIAVTEENLVLDERRRSAEAFHALEIKDLQIFDAATNALRPAAPGDTIHLRARAIDTRRTATQPDPNVAEYPTPIVLRVREPVEIERELVRAQVRLKEQVVRVDETLEERVRNLRELGAAIGDGSHPLGDRADLHAMVSAQSLVTSSLSEASRAFIRIWDGYVFNRLDPSSLTETLIATLAARHRREEGSHYAFVGEVVRQVRDQVDEQQAVGKLTRIMELLHVCAETTSPAVEKACRDCVAAADQATVVAGLAVALQLETTLQADVKALIERMEDWEDFQDVVQGLKDLIELQKGLHDRMKKVVR